MSNSASLELASAGPDEASAARNFVLEMSHISKAFPGVKALRDVTFRVRPGTVHALMGENGAGKSTLMKCLFGVYTADAGEILIEGKRAHIRSSKQALDLRISMIHQELQPIPHRSVMENVWLGRYPKKSYGPIKLVDDARMYRDTQELFARLEMNIDPKQWVAELSVSKIQSMEMAKAVSRDSRIIIMDEPTSSLTETEVAQLFKVIGDLKRRGVAIIYISHKMEEILTISDDVTIMRDGQVVGTFAAAELTTESIISKMVGRDLTSRFPPRDNVPGEVALRVEGFSAAEPRSFRNVSFELRRGEILGIGGLVGAQRTELVEAIFGLRPIVSGRLFLHGQELRIRSPTAAKEHGMALVTEERRATGVFPLLSVADNALIASIRRYKKPTRLIDRARALADVQRSVESLKVRTPNLDVLIHALSGGNQQKVILARWLLNFPEVLILDEPTRGIDVGAKYEIYSLIVELAKQGKSIIMISSEMPELLGMSDRIMVMCEGRVTGLLAAHDATEERIMTLATQFE